jgi:hypothetical protein
MTTTIYDRDNGFARLLRQAGKSASVKVGILTDEPHEGSDKTVAEIASIHEFGGGNVPARPWLRPVVDGRKAFIQQRVRRVAEAVLNGLDPLEGMRLLGFEIVRLIQARIRAGIAPPLAESTIARKTNKAGQTKNIPLIYTGQFIGSITAAASN